jgi:hypothetical protein
MGLSSYGRPMSQWIPMLEKVNNDIFYRQSFIEAVKKTSLVSGQKNTENLFIRSIDFETLYGVTPI